MPSYRAKVGQDGSVILPPEVREKFAIRDGSEVEFFLTIDGDVFFHAITGKAKGWMGLSPVDVRSPPLSIAEMDEAVGEAVAEKYERTRSTSADGQPRRPAAE